VHQLYDQREAEFTATGDATIEKIVMLQTPRFALKDHFARDGSSEGRNRASAVYAQQNPLVGYQKEGSRWFESLMAVSSSRRGRESFSVQVQRQQDVEQIQQPKPQRVVMSHGDESESPAAAPASARKTKSGANDPCPCGSGKKYKRCHGK